MRALLFLALLCVPVSGRAASLPPTLSADGLVVTAQHIASDVGAGILRAGGNAIDAAVAVGYAAAVVEPCCGNIGGGGFLTAHLADGRNVFLDFRETAPAAASRDMYLDAQGHAMPMAALVGWKAVAVPGTVLGLDTALARWGTMPRGQVMAPAIRLAREGFMLDSGDAAILAQGAAKLRKDPRAAAIFLHPDGSPLRSGEVLRQPELARTLEAIAKDGPSAFYAGAVPRAVEAASRAGGGIITAADLAGYHVEAPPPLSCTYRGYTLVVPPPPSSGGVTLCETLNILEPYDLPSIGFHAAAAIHLMTEALRLSFFDRNRFLGDPAYVHNPLHRLLSKDYASRLRREITDRATPSAQLGPAVPPPGEQADTTSYAVIDKAGNAAAVTYTLNGYFGAGVMAAGTGFLLNDEMDDFSLKPGVPNQFGLVQGENNAIAPGKRPLSSMTPTIGLRDGAVRIVAGSPGGPRIITVVLETLLNVIDYGMDAQQAVDAPRFHHQWQPDVIYAEPFAFSPDTAALLRKMGYSLTRQSPWGAATLIWSPPTQATPAPYQGAIDARRPAGAAVAVTPVR
jgi:gamma-glutamyltranspeptidase/glutathione hydrolase